MGFDSEVIMKIPQPSLGEPARRARRPTGATVLAVGLIILSACSGDPAASVDSTGPDTAASAASDVAVTDSAASDSEASTEDQAAPNQDGTNQDGTNEDGTPADFYDASVLHSVEVSFDQAAYDAMIEAFVDTGDKEWLEADVTIDGVDYQQVGIRLKGNSSLAGLGGAGFAIPGQNPNDDGESDGDAAPAPPAGGGRGPGGIGSASAEEPEGLPWLIRLDRFVDDQEHQGLTEFVVRSSSTETALNEAVSVGLLAEAGLATQRASVTEFTVNDRPARLRLVLESPNGDWTTQNLGDGNLYKADASGDYSYRGDNPDDYLEAWEQEAGDDDLTPLIEFLEFVNDSDDATFAAELDEYLDVAAFAEYMAIEDLLENFDDISGPGNNSYLYFDAETGVMTVVAWDHNLALAQLGAGGPGAPGDFDPSQGPGGSLPEGFDPSQIPAGSLPEGFDPSQIPAGSLPEGFDPSQFPGGGGGPGGRSNVLADRFMENEEFSALYDEALERLRSELYDSGTAQAILDDWTALLEGAATHLVDAETIATESAAVAEYFVAE